jgi:hypothetical protein
VFLKESMRQRFRLFKEISVLFRKWEDMLVQHIMAPVPEDSGLANAEV